MESFDLNPRSIQWKWKSNKDIGNGDSLPKGRCLQSRICLCSGAGIYYLTPHLEFIRALFNKMFSAQKATSKKMRAINQRYIGQGQGNQHEKRYKIVFFHFE